MKEYKEHNRLINRYTQATPMKLTPVRGTTITIGIEDISEYICSGCLRPFKSKDSYIKDTGVIHCTGCIHSNESISSHKHYYRWRGIINRCNNPKDKRYKDYGARGINLYKPWITDGEAFIQYIEALPNSDKESYTLDRIDNEKGYIPNNLRWVSKQVQVLNQRLLKSSNSTGYSGVTKHVLKDGKVANPKKPYTARLRVGDNKRINLGYYETELEAVKVRDIYILEHNLKYHKTQVIHNLKDK